VPAQKPRRKVLKHLGPGVSGQCAGFWLMPIDLEQFADRDGAPRRPDKGVDEVARRWTRPLRWRIRTIDLYSIALFGVPRIETPIDGDHSDPAFRASHPRHGYDE
jgi:hypothetical protein